jgi:GxxExxY protein
LYERASGLTETIIAAAIEVHRDKGPGLIESIYEWCLLKELELRNLGCVSQKAVPIQYKGFTGDEPLRFDVLVEGLRTCRSKSFGSDSSGPQSETLKLYETAERADRVTD